VSQKCQKYQFVSIRCVLWTSQLGMYRISGSGSGQNGTRYRISQPDSAQSFLCL